MPAKSKQSRQRLKVSEDAPELTAEWSMAADLHQGDRLVRRGRPPGTGHKTQTTVRISNDVLAYFKASGAGWQTRMDAVLKRYVAARAK
jgi:uncharacterized protein (DUF4415 family)